MSWIPYKVEETSFPLQNLPYGVCISPNSSATAEHHCCTRIGDFILDLHLLSKQSDPALIPEKLRAVVGTSLEAPTWNSFMALGVVAWRQLRAHLTDLLAEGGNSALRDHPTARTACVVPVEGVQMVLPATVGDYTDFYSSKEHATNLGRMFRPDQAPLLPNWTWIPVGYHGRASSIVISGTDVVRPNGQSRPDPNAPPQFGPSKRVDMEVEVAAWIGTGNPLGNPIPESDTLNHVFGLSVFNDWSARDIQPWEYVPLGPFLAKNFASTISPWIVSLDALEPFRVAAPEQDPAPMPYLRRSNPETAALDLHLYADFVLPCGESQRVTMTNYRHMYWTLSQQVAHHTVNGCNLRPGDILASGTISGLERPSWGSLIEITNRGTEPIRFPSGAERTFVQDGDTIRITGECTSQNVPYRIGFGETIARVVPAPHIA